MFDLSKPLGVVEDLVCFGDHQFDHIVYYLPDEIDLRLLGSGPDVALQVFFEDSALVGESLEDAVGAIFSLGVQCVVSPDRLESVKRQLSSQMARDDLVLSMPPWEQGSVDLLLLDSRESGGSSNSEPQENTDDPLVRGVLGSRSPSLSDTRLSALFHARLDRRGTALVAAALDGAVGSTAGVLYDLDFLAMTPAIDLRMSADLDRCARSFTIGAEVKIYYVGADIQTTFAKLREEGAIEVELVSQVADSETQKMVDEAIQDFYDTLMRELFRPTIPPLSETVGALSDSGKSTTPVQFRFSYTQSDTARRIEVDYRKRMARRRKHNPNAHLAALRGIDNANDLVQRVPLSMAWREASVEVALPGGFSNADLLGISLVLWRGKDPVLPAHEARENGLRLPQNVDSLVTFDFSHTDADARQVRFITTPEEPAYYRWQAKLTYADTPDTDTLFELWSEPRSTSTQDLDLFPHLLISEQRIQLEIGAGHGPELQAIVAGIQCRRLEDGILEAEQELQVRTEKPVSSFTIRRPESMSLSATATVQVIYSDGRRVRLPPREIVDSVLIVNTPFISKVDLVPLVIGASSDILQIQFDASYADEQTGYRENQQRRLLPPDFASTPLSIRVLHADAELDWVAHVILDNGEVEILESGRSVSGTVLLKVSDARQIHITWIGGSLVDEGLRFIRITVRARDSSGIVSAEETVELRAGDEAKTQTVNLPRGHNLQASVQKKLLNGQNIRSDFEAIVGDSVIVSP